MDYHEEQDHLIQCKQDDLYSDDECTFNEILCNSSGWNNHNKTLLIYCIERKDLMALIIFLSSKIDPNDSRQGVTALTFAVEENLPLFVRELVRYGAHFTCEKGVEALELVVSKCFFNELIEGEETFFSQVQSNKLFKTAIVVAFESGRQSLLTKLLHCGLPLERSLLLDVTLNQPGLVKILIDNGVDVNATTSSLDTALHKSAQNNNIGSIQLLIQANSNIHAVNKNGETALYNAVCFVNSKEHYKAELSQSDKDINLGIIQLLLGAKSDINFKDLHGDTLLHKAVQLGKTDVVKLLIEAGADANVNKSGETVLHTASVVGHGEILKLLIGTTSNINATDAQGNTVLHNAVDSGNIEIVKQLMGIVSNIHATNAHGDTLLHKAARKNNFDIIDLLIKAKIKIGAVNKDGETALHAASTVVYPTTFNKNCEDIVNFKLETGIMNVLKSSVYVQCAIVQCLIEVGANINLEDINGDTPLSLAVVNDNLMLAHILIHNKADVNKMYKRNKGDKSTSAPSDFMESSVSVGTFSSVSTNTYQDIMSLLTPAPSVLWMTVMRQCPLTEMAKLLIHHGADVNVPNDNKTTILMLAVDQLDVHWIELIVAAGADVDAVDNFGNSALTLALRLPFPEIMSCKRFISLGYHSHQFRTQTHSADVLEKSQTVVDFLLKAGCSINTPNFPNPMVLAVIGGHKDYVKLLLECGGNVEAHDSKGNTLIMLAIENNSLDIFEILMASGADVINVKNKFGDLPLHFAAKCKKSKMMQIVMAKMAKKERGKIQIGIKRLVGTHELLNLDLLNERLETPIYKAAARGRCKNVKLLLKCGASVNIQSKNGNTALIIALKHGFENVAKILLAVKADVNIHNKRGESALLVAAKSGCTETVKLLIKTGADPLTTTYMGDGGLSLAANTDIAELFANAGADINLRNIHGKSPLHCAVKQGKEGVVRLLLDLGANVNVKDFNGNTPLITAHRAFQPGIILCLLGAKADVNLQNKRGKSALMYASDMNNAVDFKKQSPEQSNTFDLLLNSGADVNLQDNIGRTALMYSYKQKIECDKSQKLVKHGADLEAKDYQGRTSLVQVLLAYGMNSRVIELLKLGANPVIDAKYRNLLMQPSGGFSMDENEKRNQLLRLVISNGIFNQMCFISYFPRAARELTTCVVELCLLCDSYDLLKYILANCCISKKDLAYIRRRQNGITMHFLSSVQGEMDTMILRAGSRPWPLFKLAYMAVSTMMGESPEREVSIGNSQLPNPLKDALMFQTEVARTPVQEWSKLPEAMCFEA